MTDCKQLVGLGLHSPKTSNQEIHMFNKHESECEQKRGERAAVDPASGRRMKGA
jgi:hypothetical protein